MADMRTGGELVVASLEASGVERVFCVPGESYLAVLDALVGSSIEIVNARHEGGAAMMAEAWGKLTGKPGVCLVTRGPGSTNAAHGVHVARQDSTPMLMLVGQVERGMLGREAFQEVDYGAFFGSMAKWAGEIDVASRIPEHMNRALATCAQGRPGPVVLAMPEDALTEKAEAAIPSPSRHAPPAPSPAALAEVRDRLASARRPVVIVGGGGWNAAACENLAAFARNWKLPVGCSFRRQSLFDNRDPRYAGHVGIGIDKPLRERIEDADLVLLLGGRMGEMASQGYTLFDVPQPKQALIHVHPDPEEIGRVYAPALGIVSAPGPMADVLARLDAPADVAWEGEAEEAHAAYLAWAEPRDGPGDLQIGQVVAALSETLPEDAVVTNGAGNYAAWVNRHFRYKRFGTQLAPTSGSMGYGLPAAIAAKLRDPERAVVCFAGDGCFQMTGMEFSTAVQEGAAVIVLVVDNGMYGTIRMHQERNYPGRVSGTNLVNPDFAELARACGGHGETVRRTQEFMPAFERARASGLPAVLHLVVDPRALTPTSTLSA